MRSAGWALGPFGVRSKSGAAAHAVQDVAALAARFIFPPGFGVRPVLRRFSELATNTPEQGRMRSPDTFYHG